MVWGVGGWSEHLISVGLRAAPMLRRLIRARVAVVVALWSPEGAASGAPTTYVDARLSCLLEAECG
jgi:hypothetical protein